MIKYYALYQNFDEKTLSYTDIVREDLIEDIKKELKKTNKFDDICKVVKSNFRHHYWSKCEYEFIASNWSGKDFEQKIDVFYQLEPNIENITRLILLDMKYIEHKGKLIKFSYKDLGVNDANI